MAARRIILSTFLFLAAAISAFAQSSATDIPPKLDEVVANYRQVIVLTEGADTLDEISRDRVTTIGRMLFEQNLERLAAVGENLSAEARKPDSPVMSSFLDRVENNADYRDADKLAFRELFEDLAAQPDVAGKWKQRIGQDLKALDEIQALYQKEISAVFGRYQTRGMVVHREAWDKYLAFIKQKYQREQILKQYESWLPASESRGSTKHKNRAEFYGNELPQKTILLTFDDGPHPRYTAQVLDILKQHNIQAIFFQVGKNLGTIDAKNEVKLIKTAEIDYRILSEGSALGNHSYTHACLPKLNEAGYTQEIDSTNQILKVVLKGDPVLFRPPYGASNDAILTHVQSLKEKTMIWNIDSLDWADPVPNSVAQRVLDEVAKNGRGIVLFHDIHKRTLEVLPIVIDSLEKQGYHFASWNGTGIDANDSRGTQVAVAPPAAEAPYRESWAAIIGIDNYDKWPKLRYAAHDAEGVRDVLINKYKFKADHVFTLLNEQATRQNILSLLGDKLGNPDMVKRDDRVFVFFAGHGATRKLPSGRDLGYIIPVDADLSNYQGLSISMTNFQDIAETIPAKHLLFVMDSCYSGLALTRGGTIGNTQNYLQEITRREARQMFTAGGADQQVADNGPNGHSVFTWTLLQALDGRGDLNGDGVITASELAAYVSPAVSALSHQTPAFGNLPGSEGGDFIFELKHESEFLDAGSTQLNDDAIKLNAELEKLRAANEDLKRQLAEARAGKPAVPVTRVAPTTAAGFNDEGMRLYKEKQYERAAAMFVRAAQMDMAKALFANNAGFAYYKWQKYDVAVEWFQKAIALDPARAVAYVNMADAYAKLQKADDAKKAYQQYLDLAPNGPSANYARQKLGELGAAAPAE